MNISPIVGILPYNSKGEILMFKANGKWFGKWVVCGGHVEFGEKIENAALRELKEETNLDGYNLESLGFQESIFPEQFHKKKHFIMFDFCCKVKGNIKTNHELEEHQWILPKNALKLDMPPSTKKLLEKFINR